MLGQTTLASTPTASTREAVANAVAVPMRWPSQIHSMPEGAAVSPTTIQITGSSGRIAGAARTIATRNVAVVT
jgi:hypothetical protein